MKLQHFAKVSEQGKLSLNNEKLFKKELQAFYGKEIIITIEKKSKKRSIQQNRYYHGVVVQMIWQRFTDLGNAITKEKTHEILRYKFLQDTEINTNTGEILNYIKSTTELSTGQFLDYIAAIQEWAATDLEVYIPDPNEIIEA